MNRRTLLKTSFLPAFGIGTVAGVAAAPLRRPRKLRDRPPGAIAEDRFLAQCIECERCVHVWPPPTVHRGKPEYAVSGKRTRCGLCLDACRDGALKYSIRYVDKIV